MKGEKKIKAMLKPLFEKFQHQGDVVVEIHKKFIPDWENIDHLEGHPSCGKEMSLWLFEKFIEFDKKHHPDAHAGGAWLNWGFSTDEKLGWEVIMCPVVYLDLEKAA